MPAKQRITSTSTGMIALFLFALPVGCNNTAGERARADEPLDKNDAHMTTSAPHKHTNHLIHATSPYLLQHAHNPVDWYEWGPDALERARKEDKPIFLSIGYSACHWCHVMERESFENEEIAAVMNEHFVCIKVDREERPDLDEIYMAATQALTRSGGWPMSVWLTPALKPFYAGTYFPPEDRYQRPGFKRVLLFLADKWKNDRESMLRQADHLTDTVVQITTGMPGKTDLSLSFDLVTRSASQLAQVFDPIKGGLRSGGRNKFPPSMAMDLMLRAYHHATTAGTGGGTPEARLLELVELTLEKMAHGGIYDHLGGGIARYSTDPDWLVPHFEKMLYDQALVSDIYLKAYQLTKKPLYARVARGILDYVIGDLQSPDGGYTSSRDADSEGVEGKFYVWSRAEVEAVLGEEDAGLFCDYYGVSASGNWEGHNILNVPRSAETVAKLHKIDVKALEDRIERARKKLFEVREKRIKPHLDDKVLASWNGLMIASMARGYRILNEPRYRESATRAAAFIQSNMTRDGRLMRTYRQGKTHTPAFLDDYAFMIEALLDLYETTFETRWLNLAADWTDRVVRHHRDPARGGYFFSADDAEKLIVRTKDAGDGAIPSGNSVMLMNLLRLSVLLDRKDLAQEADRLLAAFGGQLAASPYQSERMLCGLDFYFRRPREIALVAPASDLDKADPLIEAVWQTYVPNLVLARLPYGAADAGALAKQIPLLAGKKLLNGSPAAYVCKNYTCQAPTHSPDKLRQQISR